MVVFRTSGHIISNWCTIHCIMFARVLELCLDIKDAGYCPNCVSIARKSVLKELVSLKYNLQFCHTSKEIYRRMPFFCVWRNYWVCECTLSITMVRTCVLSLCFEPEREGIDFTVIWPSIYRSWSLICGMYTRVMIPSWYPPARCCGPTDGGVYIRL